MATYNGAAFIEAQLESLLHQTRLPDELVVCDDRSNDATVEIVERFAAAAPFAVAVEVNPSNLGPIRNFERAIGRCTGDIIFLSDQDDYWLPDKIEDVLRVFASDPKAMVVLNDQQLADQNLVTIEATTLGNIAANGSPDSCFNWGCCSAHRRSWRDFILPIPDGVPGHDDWINGLAQQLGVATIHRQVLQIHRRHSFNVTSSAFTKLRPMSRLARYASEFGGLASTSARSQQDHWAMALRWHRLEAERVGARLDVLDTMGVVDARQRLADLHRRIGTLETRAELAARPRRKRILGILRLERRGAYRQFSGWKSALKDLFQSPAPIASSETPTAS